MACTVIVAKSEQCRRAEGLILKDHPAVQRFVKGSLFVRLLGKGNAPKD